MKNIYYKLSKENDEATLSYECVKLAIDVSDQKKTNIKNK